MSKKEIEISFSEVDSLRIVWHGHFIKYFEIGREAFGKEYGLSYLQVYDLGFFMPIVKVNCDYKRPIKYGDIVTVETAYQDSPAAKIKFNYTIRLNGSKDIVAIGNTEQVFLDTNQQLQITMPPFFEEWKKNHGLKAK